MFDGSILMVTGGTGSFSQSVLDRFPNTGDCEIGVFSRDEKKQEYLRLAHKTKSCGSTSAS